MNEHSAPAKDKLVPDKQQQPLVSVIIPTWNAADYLPSTLETVFKQTWTNVEILIIDDGSTDSTSELLNAYSGKVTTVVLENSGGPSRPRNKGIEHSSGEFIAFFDSDDLMEPEKLQRAMEIFEKHPEVDLVCSNFRSIDPDGQILNPDYLQNYTNFREDLQPSIIPEVGLLPGEKAFRNLIRANFVGTSSVVCRKSILQAMDPFDEEMKNADDIDMWMRIARSGYTFAFINKALHSYRITPGGVTARGARRVPAMVKGLENQLPHCPGEEDRQFILSKIRKLHLGRAWEFRKSGDLQGARKSYREGLAMGWGLRPMVGLILTYIPFLNKKG